jgi:uncharacterized oxidoreductase
MLAPASTRAAACSGVRLLGSALTGGGVTDHDNKTRRRVLGGAAPSCSVRRASAPGSLAGDAGGFLAGCAPRDRRRHDRVRIAGEPEREMRAQRSREGIPVDDETWNEIRAAAGKVNLAPERVDALARGN